MEAVDLKRLTRNLEESNYNEGSLDLAVRCHDAHEAILSLIAEVESLRKQLEDEKKLSEAISRDCNATALDRNDLRDQLFSLRSSKDADIERAIRLTIAKCDSYTTGGSYRVADTIKSAVLAQVKEQKKP